MLLYRICGGRSSLWRGEGTTCDRDWGLGQGEAGAGRCYHQCCWVRGICSQLFMAELTAAAHGVIVCVRDDCTILPYALPIQPSFASCMLRDVLHPQLDTAVHSILHGQRYHSIHEANEGTYSRSAINYPMFTCSLRVALQYIHIFRIIMLSYLLSSFRTSLMRWRYAPTFPASRSTLLW